MTKEKSPIVRSSIILVMPTHGNVYYGEQRHHYHLTQARHPKLAAILWFWSLVVFTGYYTAKAPRALCHRNHHTIL